MPVRGLDARVGLVGPVLVVICVVGESPGCIVHGGLQSALMALGSWSFIVARARHDACSGVVCVCDGGARLAHSRGQSEQRLEQRPQQMRSRNGGCVSDSSVQIAYTV